MTTSPKVYSASLVGIAYASSEAVASEAWSSESSVILAFLFRRVRRAMGSSFESPSSASPLSSPTNWTMAGAALSAYLHLASHLYSRRLFLWLSKVGLILQVLLKFYNFRSLGFCSKLGIMPMDANQPSITNIIFYDSITLSASDPPNINLSQWVANHTIK